MDSTVIANLAFCQEIVDSMRPLLYYTHIPAIALSLLLGIFVYSQNTHSISALSLFAIAALFSLWSTIDLIVWLAYDKAGIIVFLWSFFGLLYLLVYVFSYVFFSSYVRGGDLKKWESTALVLITLPVIVFLPTRFNVEGYDLVNCQAFEGVWYANYYYWSSVLLMVGILVLGLNFLRKEKRSHERKRLSIMLVGLESFLILFFSIGYLVSYLVEREILSDFGLEQYGLLGMPVFVAFLAYLIIAFKTFNVRLIAAQALVVGLVILVGSQYLFTDPGIEWVLVTTSLSLSVVGGYFLIRSVQREIKRKEELQKISDELAKANEELRRLDTAKSEFISIASHQLRTPLTAIKGFLSLLLEGSYGKVEPTVKETLNKVYLANARLMNLVENLLSISRIEAGRIQYQFAPTKIDEILQELYDLFQLAAKEKNLSLSMKLPPRPFSEIVIDGPKIREVISNLIDNAIKYTKEGGISIEAQEDNGSIVLQVSDTGIGIDSFDLPHLFNKFERGKQAARVNVSSTGLGLYVGKRFVEAHDGTIEAISKGVGQGSTFVIRLPLKPIKSTA